MHTLETSSFLPSSYIRNFHESSDEGAAIQNIPWTLTCRLQSDLSEEEKETRCGDYYTVVLRTIILYKLLLYHQHYFLASLDGLSDVLAYRLYLWSGTVRLSGGFVLTKTFGGLFGSKVRKKCDF